MGWHHDEGILTWIGFMALPESEQWEVRFFLTSLSTNPSYISNPHPPHGLTPPPLPFIIQHAERQIDKWRMSPPPSPLTSSHFYSQDFPANASVCVLIGCTERRPFGWVLISTGLHCFPLSFYCTLKMNRGRVFTRAIRGWEHSQRSNRAAGLMATVGLDLSPPESWISASRPSFFHKALQSLPRHQMFVNTNVARCGQMIYFPPFASVGLSLRR